MRLRIAAWNVRSMPHPIDQLRLLDDQHTDIVLLQDVGPSAVRAIAESSLWSHILHTWSTPPVGRLHRRGGCLIATSNGWLLAQLPAGDPLLAHRLLAATATRAGTTVSLISCYAPTNTGPGRNDRPGYFTALADWLTTVPAPTLLAMDANGPRVDDPDIAQSIWWTPEESAVLGAGASTSDALRLWYAEHPADFQRRTRHYPHGPLADSYHRGRKAKYLRSRYDSIRVSPGIHVLDVRYLYDDAVRAG
ncbi:MAG: hypothetical protein ABFD13_02370, partial [Candidatus Cryosericum sp.]|nr:hypothetical protein [bacterium]